MSLEEKERKAAYQKEWSRQHPEKIKEYQARWKAKNPEKAKAAAERSIQITKERYNNDPEFRKGQIKYITEYTKKEEKKAKTILLQKFKNRCEFCGVKEIDVLSIHHLNGQGKEKRPNPSVHWREYLKQFEAGEEITCLCRNCHSLADRRRLIVVLDKERPVGRKVRSTYPFEGRSWKGWWIWIFEIEDMATFYNP